jgi:hypothetical protein
VLAGCDDLAGDRLVRISVSNHTTGEADVDMCVEAIIAAARSATTG